MFMSSHKFLLLVYVAGTNRDKLPNHDAQSTRYNHFHNILRLFDVLPIFLFTKSETMRRYYL